MKREESEKEPLVSVRCIPSIPCTFPAHSLHHSCNLPALSTEQCSPSHALTNAQSATDLAIPRAMCYLIRVMCYLT